MACKVLYQTHNLAHSIIKIDTEKNFTSTVDRAKNEPISFGRSETQKITRSNNPPIKATLFWSHFESKRSLERDIMLGQVAGYRRQGKP
jgi:hypothetical protein